MRARVSELEGGGPGGWPPPGIGESYVYMKEEATNKTKQKHAWAAESFPDWVQLENSGGEALPGAKSAVQRPHQAQRIWPRSTRVKKGHLLPFF